MAKDNKSKNKTDREKFEKIDFNELNDSLVRDFFLDEDIVKSDETDGIRKSEEFLRKERDSYITIDKEFTRFLTNYVDSQYEKEKLKNHLKDQFFWFVMIGFFALMLTPLIIVISSKALSDSGVLVALITTLIELVSAIIVLPKIIAEYLFNKEEDANVIQIIKNMQEYNEKKHEHIDKNSKE